jgi:hypothetical protein
MYKLTMITLILLFVGMGLIYSSSNVSGEVGKSACPGNGHGLTNDSNNTQNYSCSNDTRCPVNQKCSTNGTGTCLGPNIGNCTWACRCQNNTTCSLDDCTFNNGTCQELGATNNLSSISCARNGPCPVDLTSNQTASNKENKGRIFTMTLNCPRCT